MITILVLFPSNTFRNFKHFYLFYVCRELKEEFPNLLSYTRFVERMPRVAVPLLLFLKLALMGECTGITFIDSTRIPVCENKREYSNRVFKGYAHKGKSTMGWYYGFKLHLLVMNEENYSILHSPKPMWMIVTQRYSITWLRIYWGSYMPIKVIFRNHSLLHSSIGEFTSLREYALIWRIA